MDYHGHILQISASDGWARGDFLCDDGKPIVVVGSPISMVKPRQRYMLSGFWVDHPVHGRQFKVHSALPGLPSDKKSLEKYIAKNFTACGLKTAREIIDFYESGLGLHVLRSILIEQPWRICGAPPGLKRAIKYAHDTSDNEEVVIYRYLSITIGSEVATPVLQRIAGLLATRLKSRSISFVDSGDDRNNIAEMAWKMFSENPFFPIFEISGYGFKSADKIAAKLNFPPSHPKRLAALSHYAITQACESFGHTFLTRQQFLDAIFSLDPQVDPRQCWIASIEEGGDLVYRDEKIYPGKLFRAESLMMDRFNKLSEDSIPIFQGKEEDLLQLLAEAQVSLGIPMDESQIEAITSIMSSRCQLHTLTAGPGFGKTTIMEFIALLAKDSNLVFAAPTGKAAKVLTERIEKHGYSAVTIHRLLEPSAKTGSFQRNSLNLIHSGCFVVDECSMVDVELMASLLSAMPEAAHLILVGDINQLPSVGPGDVLSNARSFSPDNVTLSKVYRNNGSILRSVFMAKGGEILKINNDDYSYFDDLGSAEVDSKRLVMEYKNSVSRVGIENVGFLIPRRKGSAEAPGWNITYINNLLQNEINNTGDHINGTRLMTNDRVIIRKNMMTEKGFPPYDSEPFSVVNGDTGRVLFANFDRFGVATEIVIQLDDGRCATLFSSSFDSIELAYAITVHSAQGSQYKEVIAVFTHGPKNFMNRNLIYTALSRAKNKLTVFSSDGSADASVSREAGKRNTTTESCFNRA